MRTFTRLLAVLAVAALVAPAALAADSPIKTVENHADGVQLKHVARATTFQDADPVPLPMPVEPLPPNFAGGKGAADTASPGSAIVAPAGGGSIMTAEQRTARDIRTVIRNLD